MDETTRQLVRQRARDRCEYCQFPQKAVDAVFHVDHIIASQHTDIVDDSPLALALACDRCNLYKGTNLSSIDPVGKSIVVLYHPRRDRWSDHFLLEGAEIVGRTATGRATVRLLRMNAKRHVELRAWLIEEDAFN